jgi:hypothetical protein
MSKIIGGDMLMANPVNNSNIVSNQAAEFYLYNEFFHYAILTYKISEFDIMGAYEDSQWQVLPACLKQALHRAITAYLYAQSITPSRTDYILLEQLQLSTISSDIFDIICELYYSNPLTRDEVMRDMFLQKYIVEKFLIPQEAWEIWGKDKQFNFSAYLETILQIKDIQERIGKAKGVSNTYNKEMVQQIQALSQRVTKGK